METSTQYCSVSGVDLDRRAVIDLFFGVTDGGIVEISHLHGSQCNIVCNYYLWEYPVLISGVLSKTKICLVRHKRNVFVGFNRDSEGLCFHCAIPAFFIS